MIGVEIRGEVDWALYAHIGGCYFGNDPYMPGEVVVPLFEGQDFKEGENPFVPLIERSVEAAAFFGVFEELSFYLEEGIGDKKRARVLLDEALARFTEEDITPTFEQWQRSRKRHEEMDESARQRFLRHMEFLRNQQASEDENITLREAVERHEKGTEELRRAVEGHEDDGEEQCEKGR